MVLRVVRIVIALSWVWRRAAQHILLRHEREVRMQLLVRAMCVVTDEEHNIGGAKDQTA
jgi:hypothetical protein